MNDKIAIPAARGRPMLTWVGKCPLREQSIFPAQHIETFDPRGELQHTDKVWPRWPTFYPQSGLLFHGDNKEVLAHLLANGFRDKVDLIYIDPPFDSGVNYVRRVQLRGVHEVAGIHGEAYALGEQIQYTDLWASDNYLQFMYERLLLLHALLTAGGSMYLHCDARRSHHLRCLLDEVFGVENFRNEIFVRLSNPKNDAKKSFGVMHEIVLFYSKGEPNYFQPLKQNFADNYIQTEYRYKDEKGRYATSPLTSRRSTDPFYAWRGTTRRWRVSKETMIELERTELLHYTNSGVPRKKRYLETNGGKVIQDLWDDVGNYQSAAYSEYPTAKPTEYVRRILSTSSRPGDLVLDCFLGSGTTVAEAQKMGRRWIGCDINKGAIRTTFKRLQEILQVQIQEVIGPNPICSQAVGRQGQEPTPGQLSFALYRINELGFIAQRSAQARVLMQRVKDKILVKVEDFISPTIIERLNPSTSPLKAHIFDWRSFVDSILIDGDYNGTVFNITIADMPKKKHDLVRGIYEFTPPRDMVTVAVKITDMLGEEVLISGTPLP